MAQWKKQVGAEIAARKRGAAEEAQREAAASGLPEDWVEVTDEASGRIFYGNVKTGATQFERPQ